jgi:hypothetical protein
MFDGVVQLGQVGVYRGLNFFLAAPHHCFHVFMILCLHLDGTVAFIISL